uniref:Uncharacterized protein n=1 Tax=Oryza punctata TaxID=4537 RepID=A0A0E0LS39_ORYPU
MGRHSLNRFQAGPGWEPRRRAAPARRTESRRRRRRGGAPAIHPPWRRRGGSELLSNGVHPSWKMQWICHIQIEHAWRR